MNDELLETTMLRLLRRRDAANKDSEAYNAAVAEIEKLLDQHGERAGLIAEEYNSQPSE